MRECAMGTITSNISRTINGSTSFTIGGDDYDWYDRWITLIDTWAEDSKPQRTATFTLSGAEWGVGVIRFSGNVKAVITDKTSGTTDDTRVYIDYVSVTSTGPNTVTLNNAEVGVVNGGRGDDTGSIG